MGMVLGSTSSSINDNPCPGLGAYVTASSVEVVDIPEWNSFSYLSECLEPAFNDRPSKCRPHFVVQLQAKNTQEGKMTFQKLSNPIDANWGPG